MELLISHTPLIHSVFEKDTSAIGIAYKPDHTAAAVKVFEIMFRGIPACTANQSAKR